MPGALNATVARAMVELTGPRPDDVFLNVACGSGTLPIERLDACPVGEAIGADVAERALECARRNLEAARPDAPVRLERWDAGDLPLPDGSVTAICADLPFGQLVGSHDANEVLYPRVLAEAGRVAAPNARLVVITSEVRLLERSVAAHAAAWSVERNLRIRLDEHYLRIYCLRRSK